MKDILVKTAVIAQYCEYLPGLGQWLYGLGIYPEHILSLEMWHDVTRDYEREANSGGWVCYKITGGLHVTVTAEQGTYTHNF